MLPPPEKLSLKYRFTAAPFETTIGNVRWMFSSCVNVVGAVTTRSPSIRETNTSVLREPAFTAQPSVLNGGL